MADPEYDYLLKIILIGDAGVGKTFLLSRYINEELPRKKGPTIGVEFATKSICLANGGVVKAQIWDTAGTERFKAITSAHYRKSVGALVVYDVTVRDTFLHVKKWLDELREHGEPGIVVTLVGNKVDLVKDDPSLRQVTTEEAQKFATKNDLLFEESSAIEDINVKLIFENLLQKVYDVKSSEFTDEKYNEKKKRLVYQDPSKPQSKDSSSCCN
ncbi:unnamed protein product [Moneuplotes crassus]|uniref:Uncharacterized protein n=2 Tax=Euplotes crassus TaxID=5936 RepID=A0AAD2D0Q7_EUPCR|nr:unnamed protein product [Moneuplotes crassus]|eukprot:CAMPEP_0196996932 /NCGR_PEP_ID=MMETSP1380-20130617/2698_1 /TAXON_ID=5936 /ORGANISM="Euplotes crassus, Strain CT5" /LENGTH=213 /DNA_ID=CAMNT_0042413051 /DNA_START=21 /DNA_END=662 /DNA_ORIENTATION=-